MLWLYFVSGDIAITGTSPLLSQTSSRILLFVKWVPFASPQSVVYSKWVKTLITYFGRPTVYGVMHAKKAT